MKRAADAGEISAQLNLGYFYYEGIGVKPDITKAFQWYHKAAVRGDAAAASNIGVLYRNSGRYQFARRWFSRALNLGDSDAHLDLAQLCIRDADMAGAKFHLRKLAVADSATPAVKEEGEALLKGLSRRR